MYDEKPKGFIEELQSLNEVVKKRVLIIATTVIMVVVVGVWFSYFNGIIASASQPVIAIDATTTAQTVPTASSSANGPGVWQNIENGFASIGNIFKGPSQYNIQPKSN